MARDGKKRWPLFGAGEVEDPAIIIYHRVGGQPEPPKTEGKVLSVVYHASHSCSTPLRLEDGRANTGRHLRRGADTKSLAET